jgi:hypothetical protein
MEPLALVLSPHALSKNGIVGECDEKGAPHNTKPRLDEKWAKDQNGLEIERIVFRW